MSEGSLLGIRTLLFILFLCAAAVHILLEHTRLGRYAFAIGSNSEAAFYAGIPVSFHTTAIYACGGLLTGLAGMVEASRLMTGQPTAGQGYELQTIAAVVIGGGSLRGGEGSVTGTLIGAFIMGLLANGSADVWASRLTCNRPSLEPLSSSPLSWTRPASAGWPRYRPSQLPRLPVVPAQHFIRLHAVGEPLVHAVPLQLLPCAQRDVADQTRGGAAMPDLDVAPAGLARVFRQSMKLRTCGTCWNEVAPRSAVVRPV